MNFFRTTTTGHPIIMGRKTFESFGARPLPNRTNVVLTKNLEYKAPEGVIVVNELYSALSRFGTHYDSVDEVFIIGGGEIYQESLKLANKLYITHVDVDIQGDTYFPPIDPQIWKVVSEEHYEQDEKNEYPFRIVCYERR